MELPDWPVYVIRQSGIRCVDVFDAIRDTYNVVLTSTERSNPNHQARVRDIERRRPPTPEGVKKGVRRRDLLEGKTLFLGLDWRTSDSGVSKSALYPRNSALLFTNRIEPTATYPMIARTVFSGSSATGMPRETCEQRAARKQAQAEMRAVGFFFTVHYCALRGTEPDVALRDLFTCFLCSFGT